MDKLKFTELNLSPEILKSVADMGFEETTPIQSLAIPKMIEGVDLIGQAQTGTGKTAAFGLRCCRLRVAEVAYLKFLFHSDIFLLFILFFLFNFAV